MHATFTRALPITHTLTHTQSHLQSRRMDEGDQELGAAGGYDYGGGGDGYDNIPGEGGLDAE